MKIVTINCPEAYINAIEKLVGTNGGLYPSRSELIRCAVREFLLRELKMAINAEKRLEKETEDVMDDFDAENFVRVPTERKNEKGELIREFKEYKIIKRLEDISTYEDCKLEGRTKEKRRPLGNVWFGTAFDKAGNLISAPKKDIEVLNSK